MNAHLVVLMSILPKEEPVRVCLADTPTDSASGSPFGRLVMSIMAGHPYRLVSYWYLRELKETSAVLRSLVERPENLIVDSGLYSLMFGSEKGTLPATYEAYRDYTRRYLDDVASWDFPCTIVESDTHRLLGMDATRRLREEFAPLGDRVMYVWHQPEGLDGLVELARKYSYIAIGLPELRMIASGEGGVRGHPRKVKAMVGDLLRRVHEACGDRPPRIHLLGCTVEDMMETRLAYSCDSTSWLGGVMYGQGVMWDPVTNKLQQTHLRSPRFQAYVRRAAEQFPEAAEYAAKQKNPPYYLHCLACAYAYAQYQQWLDSRYTPVPMRGADLPGGALED